MRRILAPALVLALVLAPAATVRADPYRIGVTRGSVRDVPAPLLALAGQPFQDLLKAQTGLDGTVSLDAEWAAVARDLDAGRLDFAVLQGHEFAWAQAKYPALQPLVCSVFRPKEVRALLLVRHDVKGAGLADLKAPRLAVADALKDHARLYLDGQRAGRDLAAARADTVHEAVEQVIDGAADVTVADSASWSYYQKLNPGKSTNLRVLADSGEFPPAVLACKDGGSGAAVRARLRDGFLAAHQSPKAVKLMTTIRMEKFVEPPADYAEQLKACRKAYPVPK